MLDSGVMSIGNITIDGSDTQSSIYGTNFNITSDKAVFSNVQVSGQIETAVFKTGTTQAVGGAMIFKPSYAVDQRDEKDKLIFEEDMTNILAVGCEIWVIDSEGEYHTETVKSFSGNTAEIDEIKYVPKMAIIIGKKDEKPLIVGINSGNNILANGTVLPKGLTISEYGTDSPTRVFLGDLKSLGRDGYDGYGLYADNVYLNGSLTTRSSSGKYAGVNTLSQVRSDDSVDETMSPIIFWAGAEDNTDEAIKKAPFQVTEAGYIYVENSIFAGGSISGADIYAARIHGGSKNGPAALSIYDTEKGIGFYKNNNEETFTIAADGFKIGEDYFIKIEKGQAVLKTKNASSGGYLSLQNIEDVPALYHRHSDTNQCGLYFEEGLTSFKFTKANTTIKAMEIGPEIVSFNQKVEFSPDKGNIKMQYKAVGHGYDLYVIETITNE